MPGNAVTQVAGQTLATVLAVGVEAVIATVAPVSTFLPNQRINLHAAGKITVGAGATSINVQWRRDSVTGALVGSTTPTTVVASTTNDFACDAQDAIAGEVACRTYVCTANIAGGAAAGLAVVANATSSCQ